MAFKLAIFSYSKHDELEGSDTASEATKFKIAWVRGSVQLAMPVNSKRGSTGSKTQCELKN